MARTLILGCGKLGRPLGAMLARQGHHVIGVRRSRPPAHDDDIEWLSLDIRDNNSLASLPLDVQQIIVILTPAARNPEGYHSVYQHGLENVLAFYEQSNCAPATIFVSATSVYAQQLGEWVDESSETIPTSYNGLSLLEAEHRVLKFSKQAIVVRFSGIYGANRTRLIEKLQSPMRIQQTPPTYTNRIHQRDCVGVLHHLAAKQLDGEKLHSIYLATDHDCAPKYEMMAWLAAETGLISPTPYVAAPEAPRNKRCRNQRILDSGYRFHFRSYKQGYRDILLNR